LSNRETNRYNDGLDQETQSTEPIRRGSIKDSGDNTEDLGEAIHTYQTSLGELYGFVDSKDNLYLDRRVITSEHAIHEYTHLWDRAVAERNPKLWKRGVELMKQTSLWKKWNQGTVL
jgi:hypothetical protein